MGNKFGADILMQAVEPKAAAAFYASQLGFVIDEDTPNMISLRGRRINLFIEPGPALGPVLEVTIEDVEAASHDC